MIPKTHKKRDEYIKICETFLKVHSNVEEPFIEVPNDIKIMIKANKCNALLKLKNVYKFKVKIVSC